MDITKARQCQHLLRTLGFTPRHIEYQFLTSAIVLYIDDPQQSITKELYHVLVKKFGYRNTAAVERAICYAITEIWIHRSASEWDTFFPHARKFPTNLPFISVLAEALQ